MGADRTVADLLAELNNLAAFTIAIVIVVYFVRPCLAWFVLSVFKNVIMISVQTKPEIKFIV